mmetsp:Transcript_141049/g.438482  ORF Transcript_141049/g.438482 Transcript_141049/m.438482 type:complete len:334 (+) Transcript_141049:82-1083(+)
MCGCRGEHSRAARRCGTQHEDRRRLLMAFLLRQLEGREAGAVPGGRCAEGRRAQEGAAGLRVPLEGGQVERRAALPAGLPSRLPGDGVCLHEARGAQERLACGRVAEEGSPMKRRPPHPVPGVRPAEACVPSENGADLGVPLPRGNVQGVLPAVVCLVERTRRAPAQELPACLGVPLLGGNVQRRAPLVVDGPGIANVGALQQRAAQAVQALPGGVVDGGASPAVLSVQALGAHLPRELDAAQLPLVVHAQGQGADCGQHRLVGEQGCWRGGPQRGHRAGVLAQRITDLLHPRGQPVRQGEGRSERLEWLPRENARQVPDGARQGGEGRGGRH